MQLIKFKVQGMHSAVDVISIERILKNIDGVDAVEVNIVEAAVKVRYEQQIKEHVFQEAIEKCGYVYIREDDVKQKSAVPVHEKLKKRNILLGCLCAVNILLMLLLHPMAKNFLPLGKNIVLLLTGIYAFSGIIALSTVRKDIADGWKKLINSRPSMDGFVAVGLTIIGIYSIICAGYALAGYSKFISNIYFGPLALIVFFWSLGEYKLAKLQYFDSIDEQLKQDLPKAVQLIKGNELREISSEMVFAGDLIYLAEKDIVPVNGVVVSGEASADESQVNGISIPVVKKAGSEIYAGSRITGGDLSFKVSQLSRPIGRKNKFKAIDLLKYTSESRKAAFFIPAVLVIGVSASFNWLFYTGDINFAMNILAAVLLLTSPCFYKIAVAMPFHKAVKKASGKDIIFRNLPALIDMSNISTVIFGKTGTLTKPDIVIADIQTFNGVNKNAAILLAASLESKTSHPAAEALKNLQSENLLELSSYSYEYGRGVSAVYQNVKVHFGFAQYIENKCSIPPDIKTLGQEQEKAGNIVLYLAAGKFICAMFVLAEEILNTDAKVIDKMHQRGLRTIMLSGDKSMAVERVSKMLNIQKFMTDLTAKEKYDLLRSIKQGGERVAVVSNNLCDKQLSECADISICFHENINELANVVFKKHDLNLLLTAMDISEAVQSNVKSKIFLCLLLNIISLPIACGVLYYFYQLSLEPIHITGILLINSLIILITALF